MKCLCTCIMRTTPGRDSHDPINYNYLYYEHTKYQTARVRIELFYEHFETSDSPCPRVISRHAHFHKTDDSFACYQVDHG